MISIIIYPELRGNNMEYSQILKIICDAVFRIAFIYFSTNQWINGVYALLVDALVIRLDYGGNS